MLAPGEDVGRQVLSLVEMQMDVPFLEKQLGRSLRNTSSPFSPVSQF